ncbi:MAG: HAD family hydrolase, partial [Acidobacteriota bacterium]
RVGRVGIQLIAIDVDGTLLDSHGRIPAANLAAIAEAGARGMHVVIATGRSFGFALHPLAPVPEPLTLIVHNGAIVRTRDGHTLDRRLLPTRAAATVLDVTRPWRDSALLLFDRPAAGQLVSDALDWSHPNRTRFFERNRDLITEVDALEEALTEDPVQVAFNGALEPMRAVAAALGDLGASTELTVSITEYPARDFALVDVCAAGTTKGTALARLAARLGVPQAGVLAVGDNFNDEAMLAWAGVGVVMANADPALLSRGFATTGTNDEAGLAAAIRTWALGDG